MSFRLRLFVGYFDRNWFGSRNRFEGLARYWLEEVLVRFETGNVRFELVILVKIGRPGHGILVDQSIGFK